MFKKIVLGLFTVITLAVVAILAIAATRPPTYHVERSATMSASPSQVYAVLTDFHRFPEWSPWQKLDPNMKITFGGAERGQGATYAWVGNNEAGAGKMTILECTPDQAITEKLEFVKPFKDTCVGHFAIAPEGAGSRVTWTMDGNHNLVSKVMCMFVSMDSMIGKDFEAGLASLTKVAEAEPAPAPATPAEAATTSAAKR